jgi:hypothetical protein
MPPSTTASPTPEAKPTPPAAQSAPTARLNVVSPVPATCVGLAQAPDATSAPAECPTDDAGRLTALDSALTTDDVAARDTALKRLEPCSGFEPGLLRALRADLAPPECADAIVEPLLKAIADEPRSNQAATAPVAVEKPTPEVVQVLRGLAFGARLMRTSDAPPQLSPPFTRDNFQTFLKAEIRPWYVAQSKAVFDLASAGAKLAGYGKAIVALEAGLSDLRFVENVRKVPLPSEMTTDREVVEVYQQALEDALDPRKLRGRDAVLVAMIHLSQLGVLTDPRLDRARAQVARLFAGSRINALDSLMLPPLEPLANADPIERLAAKLPPFFADRVLRAEDVTRPKVVRALLERGLPPRLRQQLERASQLSPEVTRLFARGQLELGRRYFRPADFTRASVLLKQKGVLSGAAAKESRLVAALAEALEGAPENATQLVLTGPMLPKGMGRIEALDRLAKEAGPLAGMAAFNAGHILSVIPQERPNPEHWMRIARYFDDAERKLLDANGKAGAHARAEDARATATQIRESAATAAPTKS